MPSETCRPASPHPPANHTKHLTPALRNHQALSPTPAASSASSQDLKVSQLNQRIDKAGHTSRVGALWPQIAYGKLASGLVGLCCGSSPLSPELKQLLPLKYVICRHICTMFLPFLERTPSYQQHRLKQMQPDRQPCWQTQYSLRISSQAVIQARLQDLMQRQHTIMLIDCICSSICAVLHKEILPSSKVATLDGSSTCRKAQGEAQQLRIDDHLLPGQLQLFRLRCSCEAGRDFYVGALKPCRHSRAVYSGASCLSEQQLVPICDPAQG